MGDKTYAFGNMNLLLSIRARGLNVSIEVFRRQNSQMKWLRIFVLLCLIVDGKDHPPGAIQVSGER